MKSRVKGIFVIGTILACMHTQDGMFRSLGIYVVRKKKKRRLD